MCAISGLVTEQMSDEAARLVIRRMNDAQRHRGPDGEGVWSDQHAYLGHRRLAIIDLTANGNQPMTSEDGSVVLVCNGEIYNFQELRAGLIQRGHRFSSRTDIEVILHLYEERGDDCVCDLVGMFAFAIWDARRRRLLLARDRIGEKPLYYAQLADGLAFASELPAILAVPGVSQALDEEAVATSLIYPRYSCAAHDVRRYSVCAAGRSPRLGEPQSQGGALLVDRLLNDEISWGRRS